MNLKFFKSNVGYTLRCVFVSNQLGARIEDVFSVHGFEFKTSTKWEGDNENENEIEMTLKHLWGLKCLNLFSNQKHSLCTLNYHEMYLKAQQYSYT